MKTSNLKTSFLKTKIYWFDNYITTLYSINMLEKDFPNKYDVLILNCLFDIFYFIAICSRLLPSVIILQMLLLSTGQDWYLPMGSYAKAKA